MIPTELEECLLLVEYLELRGFKFCHINNEMFTRSWKQKNRQVALGSAKGFPDYLVLVGNTLVGIEMKRIKGSVTSQAQKEWIERLNAAGVETRVCKGCEEAIKFINEVEANNKEKV